MANYSENPRTTATREFDKLGLLALGTACHNGEDIGLLLNRVDDAWPTQVRFAALRILAVLSNWERNPAMHRIGTGR